VWKRDFMLLIGPPVVKLFAHSSNG